MESCRLFCGLGGKKKTKKAKGAKKSSKSSDHGKIAKTLLVFEHNEIKLTSFVPFPISGPSKGKGKVMSHESPVEEVAYEGGDEHDGSLSLSIKRENSDFDLKASEEVHAVPFTKEMDLSISNTSKADLSEKEAVNDGHLSDPGIGKAQVWDSPKLSRSCSDLGRMNVRMEMTLQTSQSFEQLQKLAEKFNDEVLPIYPGSPLSHCSADKVILRKCSSSQILPSRSRKLWWKLFLWSHRNLHNHLEVGRVSQRLLTLKKPALNQQGGYSSDTLEPRGNLDRRLNKEGSPNSSMDMHLKHDHQSWGGFHGGASSWWPQNQWVAFPGESSTTKMSRVEDWVKELSVQPAFEVEKDDQTDSNVASSSAAMRTQSHFIPDEISHANSVIQSLNSSSTVAHIVGMGLKVVPHLSTFFSLKSVNLSGNLIGHITPGSLPKGLHSLNLSKNKISSIEGLRELTRLRVLDLSYNRITRIGQGLSNCTLIKELYLAGNKISDVEGLHRLLKLTVLDLSFNRVTTTKALGQLVANYDSLLALNLLGNPIQSTIGDDQLRKTMCGIIPKLAFLNKQPVNPQKAREVRKEAIAKVALGSGSGSSHRRAARKASSSSVAHKSRLKSRSRVPSSKAK